MYFIEDLAQPQNCAYSTDLAADLSTRNWGTLRIHLTEGLRSAAWVDAKNFQSVDALKGALFNKLA